MIRTPAFPRRTMVLVVIFALVLLFAGPIWHIPDRVLGALGGVTVRPTVACDVGSAPVDC